jgi:hypothetical protein
MRNPENFAPSGDGYLSAATNVEITDIFGRQITRRVSVGRVYGVGLNEARRMVENARTNNPGQNVRAKFTVSL